MRNSNLEIGDSLTNTMSKQTFPTLMRRMSRAGFQRDFVSSAILPEWWDEECITDPDLLPELEIRIARFLGLPLAVVTDPKAALVSPTYAGSQLRQIRPIDQDRLTPAIHSAIRIAGAAVRSLRLPAAPAATLPPEPLHWRQELLAGNNHSLTTPTVTLDRMLTDLWSRGIPVLPIETLPTPSFQAMVCIVEDRPVIALSYRHDEPGRVAFLLAHEAGHIAAGDCSPESPVVDAEEWLVDDSAIERIADAYATNVLVGSSTVPSLDGDDFRALAGKAAELERSTGADAGAIIFAWAATSLDYATATMAIKALYRATGARQLLRHHFDQNVDFGAASATDRALLRCIYRHPGHDEARP